METIHAIRPDGRVLMGTDALRLLFNTVGLGWAVDLMEIPVIARVIDALYDWLSANRISLGNSLDGIIAAKRIDMCVGWQCWWQPQPLSAISTPNMCLLPCLAAPWPQHLLLCCNAPCTTRVHTAACPAVSENQLMMPLPLPRHPHCTGASKALRHAATWTKSALLSGDLAGAAMLCSHNGGCYCSCSCSFKCFRHHRLLHGHLQPSRLLLAHVHHAQAERAQRCAHREAHSCHPTGSQ